MDYKFYTTDVFTNKPFNGARIPVFPEADGINDNTMQLIANENNASDTVFVLNDEQPNTKRLRIFNASKKEVKPATHTLIAASKVLTSLKMLPLDSQTPLYFKNNQQVCQVYVTNDGGEPGLIIQSQQTRALIDHFVPTREELASMLSLIPADIGFDQHQSLIVSCDVPYLIVPIKSYNAVRAARFDMNAWSHSSAPASIAHGILLFSNNTDNNEADFHARLVGPDIATHEDPPVAPVMGHFANYLCQNPNTKPGTHIFSVQRGANDQRQSMLSIEMDNKEDSQLTVRIGGSAVITSVSTLLV
ncbi:PhzF family phenazine biosynthesis protein [Neptunicella sp. SCSIO 80796]|uniref:PhzF family phenazine biosynthesis protein n=1 Tax=Neptunicella plasticusilytica TaxID=3117012 RepID=UPI003A4E1B7E